MSSLAPILEAFFTDRLLTQRRASPHTVASYRDTFRLLLAFAQQRTGKAPSLLVLADLDAPLIGAFLDHLEHGRRNSIRTRNARLVAIRSLFRYAALREPADAAVIQRVLSIPGKRFEKAIVSFLTTDEIEALLAAPGHLDRPPRSRPAAHAVPDRPPGVRAHRPALRGHLPRQGSAPALPRQGAQRALHPAHLSDGHGPAFLDGRTRRRARQPSLPQPPAQPAQPRRGRTTHRQVRQRRRETLPVPARQGHLATRLSPLERHAAQLDDRQCHDSSKRSSIL